MKKKLEARLAKLRSRYDEVTKNLIAEADAEARAALGETLKALQEDINEAEELLADIDEPATDPAEPTEDEGRKMKVLGAMQTRSAQPSKNADPFDTEEYRTAFMNYVCRGEQIPANLVQKRANAWTKTADASAVIPTTILNEMIVEMKNYGTLYQRVRKLNVQGGVQIPILSLKPSAKWITADTATSESDKQKLQANTSITFNYYGLECKVAQTLLVNVVTLDMFQQMFATLAVEAIAKAMDTAIIKGTGSGEPLGITVDTRVPAAQKVTLNTADVKKWDEWKKKVFAKIPTAYRNGIFIMAQGTFDGYIDGMVDSNGQPIGRVNYGIDGGETYRFGGKEVMIVESDLIKDWDSATGHASTGDVVAIFCNLNDYAINTNLEMQTVKWVDHDTNEICNKVILIADGKLVDPNGVVIVKKGVAPTT